MWEVNDIKEGLRDAIVFGIGFIFLYLSIGMLAETNSFSLGQALSTSMIIFSTPLQFLLVQSTNNGWVLAPVILAMNARFLLMSGTLAPYLKETKILKIMFSLILIVPSIFTGCIVRFKKNPKNAFVYFLSLGLPIYVLSIFCTLIGFLVSEKLKSPILYAMMDIVLPLQFTALAAKHWPEYLYIISYWGGFVLTPLLVYFFGDYNLLLTPFIIDILSVVFENIFRNKKV
jgi:predicted branched-subunit amino acid permease